VGRLLSGIIEISVKEQIKVVATTTSYEHPQLGGTCLNKSCPRNQIKARHVNALAGFIMSKLCAMRAKSATLQNAI